ncbi:MAG: DUF3987 domain-containing protein, partial [Nocardioidaceae bacterium]|nr:DUF3987 domain-containing protein [Nocardioidaceae bacterium]
TQTDAGLTGGAVLGALSAAVGGFVQVQVRPGYIEPTNVWIAGTAGPGERKSAVIRATTNPLHDVERDLAAELAPVLAGQQVQRDVAERAAEKAKRDAGNATTVDKRITLTADASTLAEQAAGMTVQASPRLVGDDVTIEALVSHLAEQRGRFALISAEGGFFTALNGRYSDRVDITPVLKAHAGDRVRVDRKGRDSEFIDDPALTVAIMIQPGILSAATGNQTFRDSGLMARFLYCYPASKVGHRDIDPDPVPDEIAGRYANTLYRLAKDIRGDWGTRTLTLSSEADSARVTYAQEVERELGPGGDLAHMREWASKVVGASVRIAGLLHAASKHHSDIIDGNTMDAGILLARYFTSHASRVFDGLSEGSTDRARARHVIELARRKGWDEFAMRDLLSSGKRSMFPDSASAQPALDLLVEFGWLLRKRPNRQPGPGRAPAFRYRVHPSVWEPESSQHKQQKQQKPNIADSADIAEPSTEASAPMCPIHRERVVKGDLCIAC